MALVKPKQKVTTTSSNSSTKGKTSTSNTKSSSKTTTSNKSNKTIKKDNYYPSDLSKGTRTAGEQIGDPALIKGKYDYKADTIGNQNLSDYADFQQGNQRQNELYSNLSDAIAGRGPSVAQMQLERGRDQSLAANTALAASAQGGNRALALRGAQYANAAAMQNAARDAAILRAQEQIQARGEMANAIKQGQQAALDYATNQAGFNQEAAKANQAALNEAAKNNTLMGYTIAKQNQDTINAQRIKQAELAAGITQARVNAAGQSNAAANMASGTKYSADANLALGLAQLGSNQRSDDRKYALERRDQNIRIGLGIGNAASSAAAGG